MKEWIMLIAFCVCVATFVFAVTCISENRKSECVWEQAVKIGMCTNNSFGSAARCRIRTPNHIVSVVAPVVIGELVVVNYPCKQTTK